MIAFLAFFCRKNRGEEKRKDKTVLDAPVA